MSEAEADALCEGVLKLLQAIRAEQLNTHTTVPPLAGERSEQEMSK